MVGENMARCLRHGFGEQRWIIPVMIVGAITPLGEITRSFVSPARAPSTCNLLDAWDTSPWRMWPPSAYLARAGDFNAIPQLWRAPASLVRPQHRLCPLEPGGT
jgi:hypothetical protein